MPPLHSSTPSLQIVSCLQPNAASAFLVPHPTEYIVPDIALVWLSMVGLTSAYLRDASCTSSLRGQCSPEDFHWSSSSEASPMAERCRFWFPLYERNRSPDTSFVKMPLTRSSKDVDCAWRYFFDAGRLPSVSCNRFRRESNFHMIKLPDSIAALARLSIISRLVLNRESVHCFLRANVITLMSVQH